MKEKTIERNNTLFDTFGPLVYFVYFWSTPEKKPFTFHRIIQWTFLPSLVPVSPVVSEKQLKQHTFWHIWASCFFCVLLMINQKNPTPFTSHRTIQWTFLPSLVPIAPVVSEETIKTTHFLTHLVSFVDLDS